MSDVQRHLGVRAALAAVRLAVVGVVVVLMIGTPLATAAGASTQHGSRVHSAATPSATPSPTPSEGTKPGNPSMTGGRILITALIAVGAYYLLRRNTGIRPRRRRRGPDRGGPGDTDTP